MTYSCMAALTWQGARQIWHRREMWPRWPLTARPGAKRCASAAPRSVSRNGSHLTQRPRSGASNSPTHSSQAGTRSHVCGANRWPPVGWGFLLNLGGVSLNTVSLCTCILMYLDVSCQIHAGYMQNTCGIPVHAQRTYLLAACQIHVDTCRIHARQTCKIQGSSVYLGTADKTHARYMQDTCRIHAGYMWDTCGIRGSSVYLGTAVQIRSRYAGYVLKRCRICAGTANRMCRCIPSRFGDLTARRDEVAHQSGLHVFHPLRQIHSRYIRIHHNT